MNKLIGIMPVIWTPNSHNEEIEEEIRNQFIRANIIRQWELGLIKADAMLDCMAEHGYHVFDVLDEFLEDD